jgi:ribonuclease Z
MPKLIILGSSNAVPTPEHENTHMALVTPERTILVDCASNPIVRLEKAGIPLDSITDLILTHFHPDHVAGVPLLLMDMWLLGRRQPLNIYGYLYTLKAVETVMGLFDWTDWPNFFKVNFCRIPEVEMATVLETPDLRIHSSPVKHFLPNMALRFELKPQKKTLAYSCDTEPCPALFALAQGVDILLHEAAGPFTGHSSAAQAGELARQAGVGSLYIIHYPTGRFASGDLVAEARARFQGEIIKALDFMEIDLNGAAP